MQRPEGKTTVERCRHSWEDNMKKDLKEIWYEIVEWIHLA
jgi:hypothetical protein